MVKIMNETHSLEGLVYTSEYQMFLNMTSFFKDPISTKKLGMVVHACHSIFPPGKNVSCYLKNN
jgi:hypothetical protein